MSKWNKQRSEFLGMSWGAACNRLRKMVMFHLLKRLGENYCFRCGKEIVSEKELSLEHKKNWWKIDKNLFWDINNITFSHLKCNSPERRYTPLSTEKRRYAPVGMAWCSGCKDYLSVKKFGLVNGKPRDYCNGCRKARGWEHTIKRRQK